MIFTSNRVRVVLPNGRHFARVESAEAERMVMRDEARQINGTRIELRVRMRTHHEPMEAMGPTPSLPFAPKARRTDSSHGDAGRGWAAGNRTLHAALGLRDAGHYRQPPKGALA